MWIRDTMHGGFPEMSGRRHSEHPIRIRWRLMEDGWKEGGETDNRNIDISKYRDIETKQ